MILVHIFSPVCALVINVSIQISICRYFSRIGLLKSVFLGFFFGLLALSIFEGVYFLMTELNIAELSGQFAMTLIIYFALGYCYFHFINLGETARRIRIVRELLDSDGGLTKSQLLKRYNASDIIQLRLQRMISNGQIVLQEDNYYIGKPLLLYMAQILVLMKLLLLNRRGELD